MGLKLTVTNAIYGGGDPSVTLYLTNSGITDEITKTALDKFVSKMKSNSLWDKFSHIAPFLGTTYEQNRYNLKDGSIFLTPLTATNTINKGIFIEPSKSIATVLNRDYMLPISNSGGSITYFINETQSIGRIVLSSSAGGSNGSFNMSGSFVSKLGIQLLGSGETLITPTKTNKCIFSAVISNSKMCKYYYNKEYLNQVQKTSANNLTAFNVTIGEPTSYSASNTISFVSFGQTPLTDTEIILFQSLVADLISEVHGIFI